MKISDLGYSLDIRKVAENQLINAQARDELPGTPPFTSPELLQARVDRKNVVQTAIKYALSIETQADKITSLKTLARRNASKDKDQKIGDWAAKAELEKLIGSDTFKSAEFQAAVSAADAKYQQSLAIVQAAPEKLDVFSAAMTAWMCFNPDVAEPDPELPTHKIVSDKERLNRLVKDGRPSLKVQNGHHRPGALQEARQGQVLPGRVAHGPGGAVVGAEDDAQPSGRRDGVTGMA